MEFEYSSGNFKDGHLISFMSNRAILVIRNLTVAHREVSLISTAKSSFIKISNHFASFPSFQAEKKIRDFYRSGRATDKKLSPIAPVQVALFDSRGVKLLEFFINPFLAGMKPTRV